MKKEPDSIEWAEDFSSFMQVEEIHPPQQLSQTVQQYVHRDLHPGYLTILVRLALIHATVGSLSLFICAQFGMGRGSLVHAFMKWGDLACMMACGSLFLGLTTLMAGMILSRAELRRIRSSGYSLILLLGIGSLFVFFCFGADILLSYALTWLIGAIIAGIIGTELSLGVKRLRFS